MMPERKPKPPETVPPEVGPAPDAESLTGPQIEVMNVVWDAGPAGATVADVWAVLGNRRSVARNTVQTTLVRLEDKGWLTHRPDAGGGTGFRYTAARPRDSTLRRLVGRLVDTAFAGSADGLVMALLQGRRLTRAEADRIRAMIDRAQAGPAVGGGPAGDG